MSHRNARLTPRGRALIVQRVRAEGWAVAHAATKFCDECGASRADGPAPAPVDDGAVRRTVTIMFADLVGSTAFGEAVDAEAARREMAAYHQLAQQVIERFGGSVVKYIGDGVMGGFGLSEVAEDDADRAVRAGLEPQRKFATIADGIRSRHGAEVALRVGINGGEVVIADDDADIVGDAINTAARIEAQCAPGRVLVGEQTWRLTRSTIDYEVLGEVEVKGKAEAIATFQVLAAVADEEVATPFVGRREELATLTASLEDTIAARSPQLVTVIGSPGVGRTRLAAELAIQATEVTSFDIRVDRAGAATFQPIADVLCQVTALPAGLSADDVAIHLRAFVGEVGDAERLVPLLASFVGAAEPRSTEESLWAARRLVELTVDHRPAVIVIDDIQWAEPLFLDLLEHLVEWVEGAAFLIALARPEIRDIRPAFTETGRRVSEVIRLEGLDSETTAELAAGILGADALPPGLAERLPESTQGNPLFVRELVRMLVDDGTITETADGWTLAIDVEAIEVPPTIMSLLATRVERMDDDERRVVEAAGIVGSEFPRGAVAVLLPNLGGSNLDRILERLRRQEVIDATGSYWGDEPVWRFHHVLIRGPGGARQLSSRPGGVVGCASRPVGDLRRGSSAESW